jgi:hypothetical protein
LLAENISSFRQCDQRGWPNSNNTTTLKYVKLQEKWNLEILTHFNLFEKCSCSSWVKKREVFHHNFRKNGKSVKAEMVVRHNFFFFFIPESRYFIPRSKARTLLIPASLARPPVISSFARFVCHNWSGRKIWWLAFYISSPSES